MYKTVTYDENAKTPLTENAGSTIEFKDKDGRIVMKAVYGKSVLPQNVRHDTYYVYDQYGNLSFVLTPQASLASTITSPIMEGLCYQYRYDSRNRLVAKKLPGKQWEYMVYDKLNRLVASGPVLSPFSDESRQGWSITKYDVFNRPVISGWKAESTAFTLQLRKEVQQTYSNASVISEAKSAGDINIKGIVQRYTNLAYPTDYQVLSVEYYDDYSYPNAPASFSSIEGQSVFYNNAVKPRGMKTGTLLRVPKALANNDVSVTYYLYDSKGRVVRTSTTNYLGGYDHIDTKYRFDGVVNYVVNRHKRLANTPSETVTRTDRTYTFADRLQMETFKLSSEPEILLSYNIYSTTGNLVTKHSGGNVLGPSAANWQRIDYAYNIRGWLKRMNNPEQLSNNQLFGYELSYEMTQDYPGQYEGVGLYNGNISEVKWASANDLIIRKYGYFYDNMNRLTDAVYLKPYNININTGSYNEHLKYSPNGNITSLYRTGHMDNDDGVVLEIDDLEYWYGSNSNRLLGVTDYSNCLDGFSDSAQLYTEYEYDVLGNMTRDYNKKISKIRYNHLNLPTRVEFENGGVIEYLYDASGVKLNKTVTSSTGVTTTDYLGAFQYRNGLMDFITHSEGYIKTGVGASNSNVFQLKDHLGNVRINYGKSRSGAIVIMEENNYYPFGLKHENYNAQSYDYLQAPDENGVFSVDIQAVSSLGNKYKFQGQERQDELGLNWDSFKWRNYDYAIGRFMSIDPLAEKYAYQSPYNFAENRVIDSRELEGLEAVNANKIRKQLETSSEATKFYVTVNVDQPGKGGNRDTYTINGDGVDVGHSYLTLSKVGGEGELASTSFGLYPKDAVQPGIDNSSAGIINSDDGHEAEVKTTYEISESQFGKILDFTESDSNTTYDLNNNNCTDFVLNAMNAAGIKLPDTKGSWPGGSGSNPGDLGEDLKKGQKTPTIITTKQKKSEQNDDKKIK